MSLPPTPDPEPIRVEPLDYHIPSGPPRPGIVIAVGTISIFVAVIGGLVGTCVGFYSVVLRSALPMLAAAAATMPATGPAATQAMTGPLMPPGGVPFTSTTTNASDTPFVLLIIVSVVSLGLAIMLLVAGILALTGRRSARKLHLIYAALKILTAIAGFFAFQMVVNQLMRFDPLSGTGVFTFQFAILAALGCIYPLALLLVMNTQSVKSYYASITVR